MSDFIQGVLAKPSGSSTRGCCCDTSSFPPAYPNVLEPFFLFTHLVSDDILIKVLGNTSRFFPAVDIICLIIHKALFLTIKKVHVYTSGNNGSEYEDTDISLRAGCIV